MFAGSVAAVSALSPLLFVRLHRTPTTGDFAVSVRASDDDRHVARLKSACAGSNVVLTSGFVGTAHFQTSETRTCAFADGNGDRTCVDAAIIVLICPSVSSPMREPVSLGVREARSAMARAVMVTRRFALIASDSCAEPTYMKIMVVATSANSMRAVPLSSRRSAL